VACGTQTSLNQVLDFLRKTTEASIEVTYGPSRAGDVRHSRADIGKAREILGYHPTVSFAEGLRRSVEWYRVSRKCG